MLANFQQMLYTHLTTITCVYQGAGAPGNKPHVHAGITLEDEDPSLTVGRICCDSVQFHGAHFRGDLDSLTKLGVFASREQYDEWVDIVASVQHHDCSKTEFRCHKKTDAEGTKICRYHRQPFPPPGEPY